MPGSLHECDGGRSLAHDDAPTPPHYISSRSADVILSDVRPTKLSIDALDAINALLDELLHTILSAARALTSTQLRAGLHKVLPTTLGKEAVLEAELELRAYWERTGGVPEVASPRVIVEDSAFNLEWIFEYLRLKCEAYSTLSDTDENSVAETRLLQRMSAQGIALPKQTLLTPASLYLTAIIESICEHIVSNVGRVAARDSSRAIANGQDLFIALCEDSSIYGLFKNMAVYGHIETLSKMPRSRRSMSLARESDATSFRRNGSRRLSSESVNNAPTSTTQSSRPSLDKSRSVKVLYNKASQDFIYGSDPGHRKLDSFASANTKHSLASRGDRSPISPTFSEDTRSLEFDDMMRSGSTMKVSLTPDRLRTMEVLNKEKARANGQQTAPQKTERSNGITSHSTSEQAKRMSGAFPSVRRVGSIIGSEEDRLMHKPPPTSRPRQLSAATASANTVPSFPRVRASSATTDASAALPNTFSNKHTPLESTPAVSDQRPSPGVVPKRKVPPQELDLTASRPSRARSARHSRESLDMEDIAMGPDDDAMGELKPFTSPKQRDRQRGLSANTRELIAFLAEGPPDLSPHSPLSPTPKKSGRLQKMMSRISLASDTVKPPRKTIIGSGDSPSKSMTNLSPLANRPVPPRYPTTGTSSSARDIADQAGTGAYPRQRAQSYVYKPLPACSGKSAEDEMMTPSAASFSLGKEEGPLETTIPTPVVSQKSLEINVSSRLQPSESSPSTTTLLLPPSTSVPVSVREEAADATPIEPPAPPPSQRISREIVSSVPEGGAPQPTPQVHLLGPSIVEHAQEMRTMLEHATSAVECRILVDMFLARSRLVADVIGLQTSSSPPPPQESTANVLEGAIVDLFLGEDGLDYRHKLSPCSAEPAEPQSEARDAPSNVSLNRLEETSGPCRDT